MTRKWVLLTLTLFFASGIDLAAQNYVSMALSSPGKTFIKSNLKGFHVQGADTKDEGTAASKTAVTAKSSGGPDAYGYTWIDSDEAGGPVYNWIDITGTGTALGILDDNEANITIPFSFEFYGVSSTALRIGNNGGIIFNATSGDLLAGNLTLPTANWARGMVAYWDDIDDETGNVYWEVQGVEPNRQLIVEWYNRPHYNNTGSVTFEMILYERTNAIVFQYADVGFGSASYDSGVSATVGIQGSSTAADSLYLLYSYNTVSLHDNLAIRFADYIPMAHDLILSSIDTPANMVVAPSVAFTPTATIQNPGLSPESDFWVFFQIQDSLGVQVYLDSSAITSPDTIFCDSFRQLAFPAAFTPSEYVRYTAVVWTGLADSMPSNDTLIKPFRTWDLDVAASAIVTPIGGQSPDPDIVPRATFHNAATQNADFTAHFLASYGGSTMYDQSVLVSGLAGGADTTVEFPAWPGMRLEGTYNVIAYAVMEHDLNNSNDTVSGTFNSGINLWQTWIPLSTTTAGGAQAGYQDKLYMFGGYTGTSTTQISIYDTTSNSWSTSSAVLSAPSDLGGAAAARGKIFVMGGENAISSAVNANMDCYSPDGDSLNPRAAMPTAGLGIVTAVWRDSLIYRFGGFDASYNPTAAVEIYDVVSDSWTTSPTPLPSVLAHAGGTILGDTIVISTGYNGSAIIATTIIGIIDPANPDSIVWSAGPDYPGGAIYGSASGYVSNAEGHRLLIAGGNTGSGITGVTYTYSTTDGWTLKPEKTTPFFYSGGSQVGEYFVVAGGYDGSTFFTCNEALYLGSSASAQPVITATSPVDGGTDVDITSPVVVTFSKSMDTTTVTYSCIPDPGNLAAVWNYDYTVMTVSHDSFAYSTNYSFMVTAGQSLDGYALKAGAVPDSFSFGTGVNGVNGQPATAGVAFFLASAVPNPMSSGQTAIAFGLPQAGQVRIEVYNIAGQRVKTLVNGNMDAGHHQIAWNGRNDAGQRVANGVYMYRMNSGSFVATKKLLMLK